MNKQHDTDRGTCSNRGSSNVVFCLVWTEQLTVAFPDDNNITRYLTVQLQHNKTYSYKALAHLLAQDLPPFRGVDLGP